MDFLLKERNPNLNTHIQPFFWFLFLLTIFLSLLPFFQIGITNADDLEFYFHGIMKETARKAYAEGQGRFFWLITKPFFHVAYFIDNFYFTKALQYSCLLLSFTLFAVVVKKIFNQIEFALTVFLLLFVFLTVTPNYYIPFLAYPVYFTFSFSIFLFSLLMLIKYYETTKYKFLILSVIFAAFALLFYENFLVFTSLVVLFMLGKAFSEQGVKFLKEKKIYREVLPFVLICVVFVIIYYLYRWYVQTEKDFYCGTVIAKDFNFNRFYEFLSRLNKTNYPTHVYQNNQACIEANSLLTAGHQHNFWYILTHSQASSFVNAFIQCFLFTFLCIKIKPNISWKKIGVAIPILIFMSYAVHVLLALTEKHNALYYKMGGYITTYYSYFCITLLMALILYSCLKLSNLFKYIKVAVIAILAFFVFCISIIIGYSNDHLSRDWKHSRGKHLMMEKLIEEGAFDKIDDQAIVYLHDYNQTSSKLEKYVYSSSPSFWNHYFHIKTHRQSVLSINYETIRNKVQENPQQEVYFLTKYEAQKSMDILVVIAKVNVHTIDFENAETIFETATSNEATVYYYSANKEFTFQYFIPQCSEESTIVVNTYDIVKLNNGVNRIRIDNQKKKKAVSSFTLQSDDPFSVNDFAISNIGVVNEKKVDLWD